MCCLTLYIPFFAEMPGLGKLLTVILGNEGTAIVCDMYELYQVFHCGFFFPLSCASYSKGLCVWDFMCAWFSWLPEKAYWWRLAELLLPCLVWVLAAEGLFGRQWCFAEPPLLVFPRRVTDLPTDLLKPHSLEPDSKLINAFILLYFHPSPGVIFLFKRMLGNT